MAKISHANHLWKKKDPYNLRMVDMRCLVSVSSIVSVVEDVLKDLNRIDRDHASRKVRLNSFHSLEPEALPASKVIRSTAEELLQRHHNQDELFGALDATFGIYFNLGELGKAGCEENTPHCILNDGSVTDNFVHDVKLVITLMRILNNFL